MFPFLQLLFTFGGGMMFGPVGALAGSLLAAALFAPKGQKTPLEKIRVQTSSYGQPIHQVWGAPIISGVIFWPKDFELIPDPRRVRTGHQWWDIFGIADQVYEVPRYRGTWAVMLCKGPVDEVRRIWANGVLIYSTHPDDSQKIRSDSIGRLSLMINGIRIHLGTDMEAQEPLMLAYHQKRKLDAAYVPAYRGRCYILFNNYDLEQFGNQVPQITAEVVCSRRVAEADSWVDVSKGLTIANAGRRNHGAAVAFDKLWIAGGFLWTLAEGTTNSVLMGTMDSDGFLTWEIGQPLPQPREELGLVTFKKFLPGSIERLFMMGGYSYVGSASRTYWADPHDGDMVMELHGTNDTWTADPVIGGDGWPTEGRVPFPRDSFGVCYFDDGPELYSHGIFLIGGRNNNPDHRQGHEGPGDAFKDLWFFNGDTWFLETAIGDSGKSDDGGLGYREHPAMLSFNGKLYAGGGMYVEPDAQLTPKRDIHYLVFVGSPRFTGVVCNDILSEIGWPSKEDYYISQLVEFRGKVVAMVSKYNVSAPTLYFFDSEDLAHWDLMNLHKYKIIDRANYKYMVQGDKVKEIKEALTFKLVTTGTKSSLSTSLSTQRYYDSAKGLGIFKVGQWIDVTGFAEEWNNGRHRINAIASDGAYIGVDGGTQLQDEEEGQAVRIEGWYLTATVMGTTEIRREIVSDAVYDPVFLQTEILVGSASPLPEGTFYLDKLQGVVLQGDDYIPQSVSLTPIQGSLVLFGGQDAAGYVQIYEAWAAATQAQEAMVSDILRDLFVQSKLSPTQFDVSEINETVLSFVFDRDTARSAVEMLRQFGAFDVVEIDGLIKAVKRGQSPAAAITYVDLGAHEGQEGASDASRVPELLELNRKHEKGLPNRVEVVYPDPERYGEKNIQIAVRMNATSQRTVTVTTTIGMSPNKAAQMAHILLHTAWLESDTLNLSLSRKYMWLTPSDVITVTNGLESYTLRIVQIEEGRPGLVKVQAVREDMLIYEMPQIGVSNPVDPSKSDMENLESDLFILDMAIINPGDDDHGLYVAAAPKNVEEEDDWHGVWVEAQNIDGQWIQMASLGQAIAHGKADDALANADPNLWDRAHSLTVTMKIGAPVAAASEEEVRNGANLARLDEEIIQFKDVEDLGNGKYKLTNLLRGRFGTEWAMAGHAAGETFIILDRAKMNRIKWDLQAMGKAINYRAVPFYRSGDAYEVVSFTGYAIGKKPYSPAHLTAERLSDGTWHIEWMRRTRGISGWTGQTTIVPLNEKGEVYEVEFLVVATGVVKHVQTVTVLSAEHDTKPFFELKISGFTYYTWDGRPKYQPGQNDIYGGPADAIRVRVYQMSEAVGRGYPIEGTFTV